MVHIRLYGVLGKRFGRDWNLNVTTVHGAVSAIDRLKPGFKRAILDVKGAFRVRVAGKGIKEEHLDFPLHGKKLEITPVYAGASKGLAIGEIILGVALVALEIVSLGASTPFLGAYGTLVLGLGASLALGGIAALLTGTPATSTQAANKNKASYLFTSPINTVAQGSSIPVLLGEMWCGSAVGSEGLTSEDILGNPTNANTGGGGGGGGAAAGGYSNTGEGGSVPVYQA